MKQFLLILCFGLVLQAQELSLGEPLKTSEPEPTEQEVEKAKETEESSETKTEKADTEKSSDTEAKKDEEKKVEKKKVPLRIKSESSSYNGKKGLAIFKRNVVVEDGDFYLECDEMHVFYSKATKTKKGGIEKIVAIDNVKIRQSPNTATSDKAVYLLTDQTITLTGNPVLIGEDGQKMKSDHFIIHRETETIESGPVTIESDASLEKAK
ncbi:LptA/OstA family protein [Lentisphaera marina]|uniref:LptA/OstA family protein n=1 Tax=Lentisphaera marina TaxID=1111041 RepID=UPI00236652DC|nr:LptA/OstA family protein [Lentisphaera marina]MDD7986644.1 LptA/OstA family protein [Lentisphaera marina]